MNKNIKIYVWSRFISILGSTIQWVALPLYVLDKTNSPGAMGILFAVTTIPSLIISPLGGAIADRWNRKKVMIITDFINGFLTLIMYWYLMNFSFQLIWLIVVRCLVDANSVIFRISTDALLPEICEEEERTKVNALNAGLGAFANLLGPIIGGILYSIWGLGIVILINVVSFFIAGYFEMFIKYHHEKKEKGKIDLKSIKEDMVLAYEYLKNDRPLFSLILVMALMTFIFQGIGMVIMPYLLKVLLAFGDKNYGIINAMMVLGMILGSLYLQKKSNKESKKVFYRGFEIQMIVGFAQTILVYPAFLLFFKDTFIIKNIVFGTILLLLGLTGAFMQTAFQVAYQERVTKEYFGRVSSLFMIINGAFAPLGLLLTSYLIEKISVFSLMFILGTLGLVVYFATKNSYREVFFGVEEKECLEESETIVEETF